jgi:hypothetical protein
LAGLDPTMDLTDRNLAVVGDLRDRIKGWQ